ncbi:hypothetical protein CDAR_60021 [Caerostris darwini]|uniref:Uncharacterized protein n=1 Tax=Caerostris darwini TaxID=1538125 RepID=A0AAV4MP68_9ARAC|nr:hypothetical protein CDAR_60021 [Caerostris darwini]
MNVVERSEWRGVTCLLDGRCQTCLVNSECANKLQLRKDADIYLNDSGMVITRRVTATTANKDKGFGKDLAISFGLGGDESEDLHGTNVASKHRFDQFGSRSRKKRMASFPEKPFECE